jgi:hypothetical protein
VEKEMPDVVPRVRLYSAWTAARLPVELHSYDRGSHGFGMRQQNLPVDGWIERFGDWLQLITK